MTKLKIEKLLLQTSTEIENLETPELKTEALLEFLEIEYKNNQNFDLLSSVSKGLTEMLDEMNKVEILTELDYSIKILRRFQESKQFDLIAIPNSYSKDLSDTFESLKSLLYKIVILDLNN